MPEDVPGMTHGRVRVPHLVGRRPGYSGPALLPTHVRRRPGYDARAGASADTCPKTSRSRPDTQAAAGSCGSTASGMRQPRDCGARASGSGPAVCRTRGGVRSFDDLGDAARANGAATLTDGELEPFLHGDGLNKVNPHLGVVARHDHLGALGEVHNAGHVRGAEVELRTVVLVELGVRGDRARLADDLPALDVLALGATKEQTDVLARTPFVEQLAEHLDAGDRRLGRRVLDADDLDLGVDLEDAALDAPRDDGAATGDREDVLHGHEEPFVDVTRGLRDVGVDRVHEVQDGLGPLRVALQSLQCGGADDRQVLAVELVRAEKLTNLELDELHDLFVIDHVGLVEGHDDVGNADLAGQENVLLGLRHRTVGGGDDKDRTVHLCRTCDHVLDVVSVTGAVDVSVVARLRLVLDVRDGDRDPALPLLRRLVDLVERLGARVHLGVLVVQDLRDRSRQRRLTVVDVTDGADVDVRLGPLELRLAHYGPPQDLSVLRLATMAGAATLGMWSD